MRFSAFKEFKAETMRTLADAAKWMQTELNASLRELRVGLYRLRFDENFECFTKRLEIPAASELPIRNELASKVIPSWWVRLKTNEAGLSVCDGDTEWTNETLYLKNTHPTDPALITVAFFK